MSRVLIVTAQHFATQPRKVDLHFMAEALNAQGVAVDFLSMRLSWLSRIMRDERWAFASTRPLNRWTVIGPLLQEFIWRTPLHPITLRRQALDAALSPFAHLYGRLLPAAVTQRLSEYSHILVESGISLLALPTLRRLAPQAKLIYHAADRLATIGAHPAAAATLQSHAAAIDQAHVMADAIRGDIPAGVDTIYLPHGISKDAFDRIVENPYAGPRNAVSVGDMLFDAATIETLARRFPDWTFHLFGRRARLEQPFDNVEVHGETPFDTVAAYIKYADIGIAPYLPKADADYLSQSSLKMIQYTYCQLPIVAPRFAAAGRAHVSAYDPGDADSVAAAFEKAADCDRATIDISSVLTWEEKTARLFGLAKNPKTGEI
jgi:2-beta-glucuronyltransferase